MMSPQSSRRVSAKIILMPYEQFTENGADDDRAGENSTLYRAGYFGYPDALSVAHGDFAYSETKPYGTNLHLYGPTEVAILHINLVERSGRNRPIWPEVGIAKAEK